MEPESKSTSFTVDEDGDLVLLVGAGTRILVSSKVLTLASKVFKAMLSRSTFTEGRELAERLVFCHIQVMNRANNHQRCQK